MLLSFLSAALLCIIFVVADYFDGTSKTLYGWSGWEIVETGTTPIVWAAYASGVVGALAGIYIFYFLIPYIVYYNAKSIGRNPVRWATAFVVFTPLLAGIAYLLTYPKSESFKSQP